MSSPVSPSSPHQDVIWIPNLPDHLLTWSTDIKLYRMVKKPIQGFQVHPPPEHGYRISNSHVVEVQTVLTESPHYIKCVALNPGGVTRPSEIRLAVGQANGRISLLSFDKGQILKEFSPRALRQCNDLAWNTNQVQLLAGGFERARNDCAILVFDSEKSAVLSTVTNASISRFSLGSREEKFEFVKATTEMAPGESCNSLAWWRQNNPNIFMEEFNLKSGQIAFPGSPPTGVGEFSFGGTGGGSVLIAGMNNKHLKIYDVRTEQVHKSSACTFTRAVYGVCVDPFLDFRIASQFDNQVVIWDTRNFEKPVVTLRQRLRVGKLRWSPTRSGLLCSSEENATYLTIHDIQSWSFSSDEGEPAVQERSVLGWRAPLSHEDYDNNRFCSFTWHSTDETKIIAVTPEGRLTEVEVTERIAPNWSSEHCLIWPHGGKLRLFCQDSLLYSEIGDISITMQQRAKEGYGTSKNLSDNAAFFQTDSHVAQAWKWLQVCATLMNDLPFSNRFSKQKKYPGIKTALGMDRNSKTFKSDITYLSWDCLSPPKSKKVFRSEYRETAQKMCGWSTDPTDLALFLKNCEIRGEFSRGAAISCFCLEAKKAINLLELGVKSYSDSDPVKASHLNMTILSLSGFWKDVNSMWKDKVKSSVSNIKDPYLRAMFHLLASDESDDYSAILKDPDVLVSDKIAFGCLFLSDEKLFSLVKTIWNEMFSAGDLTGLFLCGFDKNAVDLLQRYLDLTGDIQTVCWMSVRCFGEEILSQNETVKHWFESYRDLLDSWRLWIERADFDIEVNAAAKNKSQPQQVYVSCNFCGSSISQHLKQETATPVKIPQALQRQGSNRSRSSNSVSMTANRSVRRQICAACTKPLPKCAVCHITMGSQSGTLLQDLPMNHDGRANKPFELFFTWCQTCRHGGHAGHLANWFSRHSECPTAGCTCFCPSLDPFRFGFSTEKSEVPCLTEALAGLAVNGTQTD